MPDNVSSLTLPLLSGLISPLLILGTAFSLITLDLRRIKWEQEQEQQNIWYQRSRLFLGIIGVLWGLGVLIHIDMIALTLPYLFLSTMEILLNIFLSAFIAALFIIMILRNKDRILLFVLTVSVFMMKKRNINKASALMQKKLLVRQRVSGVSSKVTNPDFTYTHGIMLAAIFICVCLSIILGLFQIVEHLPFAQYGPFLDGWSLLLIGIGLVCSMILIARTDVRLHVLQGIERNQAVLIEQRRSISVIVEQVFQRLAPTIALYLKKTYLSFWLVVVLGCMAFGLVTLLHVSAPYHVSVAATLSVYSGIGLLLHIAFSFNSHKVVQIIDNGIKIVQTEKITSKEQHIIWSEAHLFTCYKLPSLFLGRKTIVYYELSSPSKIITWTWVLDPQSPLTIWKPQLPIDEYHRQMQALCDLVSAKTGLELQDLSKPQ